MLHPQPGGLPQAGGQVLCQAPLFQMTDGLNLLLGRLHRLVQVGCVAVHPAVHAAHHRLLRLGVHHAHGGQRRADGRQKVLDGLALFEIGDVIGLAGGLLGRKAGLHQQGAHLPAHAVVGGGQLQMVALGRIGHRPARQKGPPEEGAAAVLLFQDGEVDVMGQALGRVVPEGVPQRGELVPVLKGKNVLPRPVQPFGLPVKAYFERLFEQGGQTAGKFLRLGDNAGTPPGKLAAEEEHPIGLRLGAAPVGQSTPAQLRLGLRRKRHLRSPLKRSGSRPAPGRYP